METFPTSLGNHLEIYMHLQALTDTMMVGFQFCLTSHSCEELIPSVAASHVNFFTSCTCPSVIPPAVGFQQLWLFLLVKISIPLPELMDVRDPKQG